MGSTIPKRWSLLLALAAGLAAVGCGGEDDSGSAASNGNSAMTGITTSSLSKEQFIQRAGEICSRERGKIAARQAAYVERTGMGDSIPAPPEYADAVQAVLLPIFQDEIDRIRELGAPEGDEEDIADILGAQQQGLDEVAELRRLSSEEGRLESHFAEARRLMEEYGLDACTVR